MTTSGPDLARSMGPSTRLGTGRRAALTLVGSMVGAGLAVWLLWPAAPGDESAEAGFARDMAVHHAQAVEMSLLIRDASSDAALRTLAYDIIVTQSTQRGVFMGWLQAWGAPQMTTRPPMAWMPGHAHAVPAAGGEVPLMLGMATDEEMRRLREARGAEAEILFLQLMIRHHEGGVVMARALEGVSRRAEVLGMARNIDSTQRVEIAEMTKMLEQRSARPLPSVL
jgi:uncharacterized protein (DUF305 family)